jgi:flagellar assembly protein FliH
MRAKSFSAEREAKMSSFDLGMGEIPTFQLESFEQEGTQSGPEPIALDENGCILIPSKKRVSLVPPKEPPKEETPPEPENEVVEENLEEKIAELEREAYEKGFEQGQKDGLALEERQLKEKAGQLETLLSSLGQLKEEIYRETEQEIVRLSMMIARKIIRSELKTGSYDIGETIRAAMKFLVDAGRVQIRISPEDMEEVSKLVPALASDTKAGRIQILEDHAIQRGGCILETGFGRVNATVEDQLALVENEVERVLNCGEGKTS